MQNDNLEPSTLRDRIVAKEIHEITYWTHYTGASEPQVRRAIARADGNRSKVERELKRLISREY